MAQQIKIWYDAEGDFLEVMFSDSTRAFLMRLGGPFYVIWTSALVHFGQLCYVVQI